jgi:hypothetical protein
MIPKHKLAILIAGLKPKGDEEKKDKGEGSDLKERVDEIAAGILDAVKEDDRDALCECLLDLCHLIREEDEEQDGDEHGEEDEDEGY